MPSDQSTYNPPEFESEIKLQLSRNESTCCIDELHEFLAGLPSTCVSQYPSLDKLHELLGKRHGVTPDQIVVSAGGDESLDRVLRIGLKDKSEILSHSPSFEMIDIYTQNHGGISRTTPWFDQDFPVNEMIDNINSTTGVVVLVSPNNPTGQTIPLENVMRIAKRAQEFGAIVLVDLAYVEFADDDPTLKLIAAPNVLVLRTFSKAWGLAGMRLGYLICPSPELASDYRAASGPFPVSGVSIATGCHAIANRQNAMQENVKNTKRFRDQLHSLLVGVGGQPLESDGNFVLCRFNDSQSVREKLGQLGIGVRIFPGRPELNGWLRITCPTNSADWISLAKGINSATDGQIELESYIPIIDAVNVPSSKVNLNAPARTAVLSRETKETKIDIELNLDGTGQAEISTGIGFLDHMLTALTFHSRMDLKLICRGDLHIDDHHTAEDCALALGTAIDGAMGPRRGIIRFGYAYAPLDEALARSVIDFSGRAWPAVDLKLQREMLGTIATENLTHVFQSLAMTLKCSLHVDVIRGENDHHKAEAAFKSLALALRSAITRTIDDVPSTKGVI